MTNYAPISANLNGVNEVVAAVSGKRIAVLNYTAVGAGAVNATWKSGTTALSGAIPIAAAGEGVSPSAGGNAIDPLYLFVTNPGEALNLVLDAAVAVGGHLTYTTFSG